MASLRLRRSSLRSQESSWLAVVPGGALAAREHRHRRQHAQEQYGARKQPVKRYVGQSHPGSLALG